MYTDTDKKNLLDIARKSIRYGLDHHCALPIVIDDYPPQLVIPRATFVTLKIAGDLRGCIGTLNAYRPLVEDVAMNAYAAAFRDPRFPALQTNEFGQLHYHLSILNPTEPLQVQTEAELLALLRPGIDGLVLEDQQHRSTFLPAVWESLPEPPQFIAHLKQKAGLPVSYWSKTIHFERYSVEDIES